MSLLDLRETNLDPPRCELSFVPPEQIARSVPWSYDADLDQVKSQTHPKQVISVCYEPTNSCPGKCPYCLIENHQDERIEDRDLHVIKHISNAWVRRVGFGGGEPLLRPEIYRQAEYLKAAGVGTLLRTSGMFPIDRSSTSVFDWVDLSLDSVDENVFKRCRPGVPLDVLLGNIKALINHGVRTRVSILLTTRNRNTLAQTVDWLADAGVRHIRTQRLVRRGKADRTWNRLKLSSEQEEGALDLVHTRAQKAGVDARELRTVGSQTLCIVKSSGDVFSASATGTDRVGHVCNEGWESAINIQTLDSQARSYVADIDCSDEQ